MFLNSGRCSILTHTTLSLIFFSSLSLTAWHPATHGAKAVHAPLHTAEYGNLPLSFEKNKGQTAPEVQFIARGDGSTLFLTCSQAVLRLTGRAETDSPAGSDAPRRRADGARATGGVLRMSFGDGGRECSAEGQEPQPGRAHYFKGRSPESWVTGVPMYAKVRYEEVYPGIDLVFYGNQRRIEYDFVVAPGIDPSPIRLNIEGAESLEIDDMGRLIAALGGEQVIQHKPLVYQQSEGAATDAEPKREIVEGRWKLLAENVVGFDLGEYDSNRPLVIDPVIVYSTYLGASMVSEGRDIAVDDQGFAYIAGRTNSPDFPTTPGVPQPEHVGGRYSGFVAKLNREGNQLVFATYLDSGGNDEALAVDVDRQGNVYVSGEVRGRDFPVTPGTVNTGPTGGAFLVKLSPDGSRLIYSTYPGIGGEELGGITVDDEGNVCVVGSTTSAMFPVVNPIQAELAPRHANAFITKLNPDATARVFSTYYGGAEGEVSAQAVTVDESGNLYVTGWTRATDFRTTPGAFQTTYGGGGVDAFLLKLSPAGALIFSTMLGGANGERGYDVAVDFAGHAYVAGETNTVDGSFPITPEAMRRLPQSGEGFVTKFSPTGDALVYSTFVGGIGSDVIEAIAVDTAGHAYVAGYTSNLGGIDTVNAIPGAEGVGGGAGAANLFAKLSVDGSTALVLAGFGGGDDVDRAFGMDIDQNCQAYITGWTQSKDFVTVNPFQAQSNSDDGESDGFVTKIDPAIETDEPTIGCRGVVEANGTPILWEGAANSIMTVFGKNFAPPGTQVLQPEVDGAGRVTTNLADTCMEVNGIRAPMYAVLEGQVNFQNPHQIGLGWASFRVVSGCGAANERFSEPEHIRIYQAVPAFFNFITNGDGINPIAAQHLDFSFAGPVGIFGEAAQTTPAQPGEIVILYGTGFGPTTPPLEAGQVPGMAAALTTNDVQVTIGDTEIPAADIAYIGIAPCCAGLYQLVVTIPEDAPNGNLPVVLTIQGRSSPEGPYIAVQAP